MKAENLASEVWSCLLRSGFVILSPLMNSLNQYLEATQRENTHLSYQSALRHFEVEWGGFLPATTDSATRDLADYGSRLASSTLHHRLNMRPFNVDGTQYELAVPVISRVRWMKHSTG